MPKKILVVDDEHFMRHLMRHHLTRAGYDMVTARNGREALEAATRERPDLVIMDVMMAEMDGLSALKEMKQGEATRRIPIIMLTASANAVTREESAASGAAAFFTKPFSPTQLLAEIRKLVPEAQ
jgi:two-component system alkaline phosphatase synthesis response regulator PhoP